MLLCPIPLRLFRITQKFGENPEHYAQYKMKGHNGLDIAPFKKLTLNQVVYAPHDGYVKLIETVDGYGRHAKLTSLTYNQEGAQRQSTLAHLSKFLVANDQFVSMGDPIGVMGSTGDSTGIHLHWTYKKLVGGVSPDQNNGFLGALDIAQFVVVWPKQALYVV